MRIRAFLGMAALAVMLLPASSWAAEKIISSYKANEADNYAIYTMTPGEVDGGSVLFDLPEMDAWRPRVSPDGSKVAFVDRKTGRLYVGNIDGTGLQALDNPAAPASLAWSSDGTKIYFWASTGADLESFWSINATGGGAAVLWGGQGYWAWFMDGGFAVQAVTDPDAQETTDYIVFGGAAARFGKCNLLRIKVSPDYQAPETVFSGLNDNYTPSLGPVDGRMIFQADPQGLGGDHAIYMIMDDGSAAAVTGLYAGNPSWNAAQSWFVYIHAGASNRGETAYQGEMRIRYFDEAGTVQPQITHGIAACPQVYTELDPDPAP